MKMGVRKPSIKKSIAAKTTVKQLIFNDNQLE